MTRGRDESTGRDRRPRLVVDGTALVPERLTGVGHVLLDTLRALDELPEARRWDIRLFAPADEVGALGRFAFDTITPVRVPGPHRALGAASRLPWPPLDAVLGRGVYFFPNYRNWPLARSRSITFVHDACFAAMPALVPADRRAFLDANLPRWLARTDLVATGTPSAAGEISGLLGVDRSRIRVLPTSVDPSVFRPATDAEVARVRAEHGLGRYLIFVGSIEPRKNVAALVRAYAASERPAGHTLLLVGGTGWDNTDVHTEIARARADGVDVRMSASYVPDEDIPALLTGADALALPSWHEGFGLPALEALACGTPVVVSDAPGIRDAVAGASAGVVTVPAGDEAALRDALSAAMRSPERIAPGAVRVDGWRPAAEALLAAAAELLPRAAR